MEGSGTLEEQLAAVGIKAHEVANRSSDLRKIEDLGAILEEELILDNRYTEHSTVGLAQQWDQLNQLGMRIRHNLEQQIQARNQSGVSEDALKEFSMMFRHFDKEKTGKFIFYLQYFDLTNFYRKIFIFHVLISRIFF